MQSNEKAPPSDSDDQEVPLVPLDTLEALYAKWEWRQEVWNDDQANKEGS